MLTTVGEVTVEIKYIIKDELISCTDRGCRDEQKDLVLLGASPMPAMRDDDNDNVINTKESSEEVVAELPTKVS